MTQLVAMKKKQEELEKVVEILVEQNKQILLDNKHLWNKMKKTMYFCPNSAKSKKKNWKTSCSSSFWAASLSARSPAISCLTKKNTTRPATIGYLVPCYLSCRIRHCIWPWMLS